MGWVGSVKFGYVLRVDVEVKTDNVRGYQMSDHGSEDVGRQYSCDIQCRKWCEVTAA